MSEFLEAAFSMPTAIFSWLMILVALYWVTVIFGLFDLGILDGLFEGAEGVAEGMAGGVEGVAEGLAEGAAEALGEGAAEALGEGAAEAAGEGTAESAGEAHGCLGLAGVPFTIIGSALVFFAWGISYGGMKFLGGTAGGTAVVAGVAFGAMALSLVATAVALRPLRKVFRMPPVTGRRDLVGRTCTVTTLRVDEKFGQAEVIDKGVPILIQARCETANELTRGSQALIYEYDGAEEVFNVTPLDDGPAATTG